MSIYPRKDQKIPVSFPLLAHSIHESYLLINVLGTGSFGQVILAKRRNVPTPVRLNRPMNTLLYPTSESQFSKTPLVAIKILNKSNNNIRQHFADKELQFILSVPSHRNLVQVFEIFVDPISFKAHIVMESLNLTLFQLVTARKSKKFGFKTLKSILSQVLNGIKHIHKHNFFHRDIKPENILVIPTFQYYGDESNIPPPRANDNYIVKLADYGLSRHVDCKEDFTSYISTRWYRSPEILLRKNFHSRPVDMWSFGLVAVELMNFVPLFPGASEVDQVSRIFKVLGCPLLPDIRYISPQTHYFIPLGGFWREAHMLSNRLGISFPYHQGATIHNIIDTKKYGGTGLVEVIKACLTWDPDTRADAQTLSSFDYFKNTCVYEPKTSSVHHHSRSNYSRHISTSSWKHLEGAKAVGYTYTDFDDGYENQFMNLAANNPNSNFNPKISNTPRYALDDEIVVPEVDIDLDIEFEPAPIAESGSYDSDINVIQDIGDQDYSWASQQPPQPQDFEQLHQHQTPKYQYTEPVIPSDTMKVFNMGKVYKEL